MQTAKTLSDPGDAFPWFAPIKAASNDLEECQASFAGFSARSPGWCAWVDKMPPRPNTIHVVGDVLVSNPGVEGVLTMRAPEIGDRDTLKLDLVLIQRPGQWAQLVTQIQARFDRLMPAGICPYQSVAVFLGGTEIVRIDHISVAN